MSFLLFLLACYGATQIITVSKIFAPVRKKLNWYFLTCPMCVGTHIGYIMFSLFWLSGIKLFPNFFIGMFIFACISSGTSYYICSTITDEGFNVFRRKQ